MPRTSLALLPSALRTSELIIRHRWLIVGVWILLVAAAGSGLHLLKFNNNHRLYFSPDNPQLLAFNALEDTFVKNDTLNFVLAPPGGQIFSAQTLAIVAELTHAAWQIPYSSRVDSLTNFQHTEGHDDELLVRDLVPDPAHLTAQNLTEIRRLALAEPLLNGALIRDDARVTAVNVVVQLPRLDEAHEVPTVVKAARTLAADFEQRYPGLKIHLTGVVMMDNAFAEAALDDTTTLIPLSFGLMILLVGLLIGGFRGALCCVLVIGLAIVIAMGIAGFIGYPVSAATSAAPVIILTVAIANCVHVLDAYLQGLHNGQAQHAALVDALRYNLKPIFLASLTTVIGFLTFNFSEVPPFRQLGNLVAFGDVASYLLALTLLPALLAILPARRPFQSPLPLAALSSLASFVIARRRPLVAFIGAGALALIACIPRNELNDVFVEYFDQAIEFRRATDFTVKNLTGVYHFYYTLEAGAENGINEPAFLRDTATFTDWLRAQPEVKHVASYTDILQRLNKNLHNDNPAMHQVPETRELAAQYLLLYEMSLPYGLDLNNQISVDKSALKVSVGMDTLSSRAAIAFNTRAETWLKQHARHVTASAGSGTALMFSQLGLRNISSMLIGTVCALVLISGVLLLMLRSVKLGLISLIPNLLPLAVGFGAWGLCVGQVGLSLSVVASMSLGIIIDDTVHFLVKYQRARAGLKLAPEAAVRYAFQVNGRAMIVTSLVLVVGFLTLSLSKFELNAGMGLLTAAVIALAVLADLFFLSPLLLLIEGRRHA